MPLIQIAKLDNGSRIINAVMAALKLAVLVYFVMYTIQAYSAKPKNLSTYRTLMLPALIVLFLVSSPIVSVLVLVAWAVLESCDREIKGLLLAVCIILSIEILYQIGVVVTGRVAMGVVGPASMRLGMGVVGRSRASSISLRA
jgi:hypothetical protein